MNLKFNTCNDEINATIDYKNIPIYIISFNRLTLLKQLVAYLEDKNYINIHIIDNHSTYPPLLDYLRNSKHKIHYMDKNYGHKVFWESGEFNNVIKNEYYVVTDSDILPVEECPDDFVKLFYEILIKNPQHTKVGFSLCINDIPVTNRQKNIIVNWEKQFWKYSYNYKFYNKKIKIYDADIDTTFALYAPNSEISNFYKAIRSGYPYIARHKPWYTDSNDILTDEDQYYINTAKQDISNYSVGLIAEELYKRCPDRDKKLNFYQKIFSVVNIDDKKAKQLTILGFKIKIRKNTILTK